MGRRIYHDSYKQKQETCALPLWQYTLCNIRSMNKSMNISPDEHFYTFTWCYWYYSRLHTTSISLRENATRIKHHHHQYSIHVCVTKVCSVMILHVFSAVIMLFQEKEINTWANLSVHIDSKYYIYICMYLRMYICMYVCMYVCIYVCVYVSTYVRTYRRMYICDQWFLLCVIGMIFGETLKQHCSPISNFTVR